MVIDYRALNGITIKDDYPLPRIGDIINRLGQAKWFSKLDLQSGYHQVEVAEEEQWKMAFRTRYGTFQFIFLEELDDFVTVYLDDVLVYSKSREEHLRHLQRVFAKIREQRLYVKLSKCEFCKQQVKYLGFVLSQNGVAADPDKLKTIRDWPEILKNRRHLRGLLGLVGYYRRLIPNFNKLAHPLHLLLRENSDMVWRSQHSNAVAQLKEALINAATLRIFDPDKPVVLKADASKHAVGAVLEQDGVPVAFESRKMGARAKYMPAYEGELLAIVHALLKWKPFIGTKPVVAETDHATLSRILQQKQVTSRLGYWLDKLADFNIKVVYRPGKHNVVADAISRRQDF
ncbi:retrotransposon ty3-gypsy subclass, partial [Cystoisospora suis]